jgi:hypothetical protein
MMSRSAGLSSNVGCTSADNVHVGISLIVGDYLGRRRPQPQKRSENHLGATAVC